jgi:hypothetical protein
LDAPASLPASPPQDPSAYVYAATDIHPRQAREIELCAKASEFDWLYTGTAAVGTVGSVILNTQVLKQSGVPGVRLMGPGLEGLFWGLFLGGGYLSFPRCNQNWAYGPPPEGDIRATAPMAIIIAVVAGATAPAIDYTFLGPVYTDWAVWERSMRIFVAAGTGVAGALLPYWISPRPWAAVREIEKIRMGVTSQGGFLSYTTSF